MADISNYDSDTIITGTAEADTIYNDGSNVTIDAGAGNDSISNTASNVTIDGGAGNNTISNSYLSKNVIIQSGAGDDTVYNSGTSVSISTGEGNDSIENGGNNVTINAGAGNDSIYNGTNLVTINAGAGDDSIRNSGDNVLFQHVAGDGNDTIEGFSTDSMLQITSGTIDAAYSTGNDVFLTIGDNTVVLTNFTNNQLNIMDADGNVSEYAISVIKGTENADYISNDNDSVAIDALGGNDIIDNNGNNVTIEGGTGNDSLNGYAIGTAYVYSAGNDTIEGFSEYNTLVLGGLSIVASVRSTENYDDIVTLNLSNGNSIVLEDYWADKVNTVASVAEVEPINIIRNYDSDTVVTGTNTRDFIYNSGENVTINTGEGNDIINNNSANVEINTGDGNDSISNSWWQGSNITVNAGNGDDTIEHRSDEALISGGTGNDSIRNDGNNVTIEGGSGDDYLNDYGYGTAYVYGGGNDILYDFKDIGTLVLGDVNILSSVRNGNSNYVLYLDNGNIIFLQDYYSSTIHTVASVSEVEKLTIIENYDSDTVVTGTALRDSIYNSGENVTVNAGAGNDSIRNHGASAIINGQDGNDYITNDNYSNVTLSGGSGNDSIQNDGDNALISGGAGNNSIDNEGNSVSITTGDGNDSIRNEGVNVTVSGGDGDDYFNNNDGIGAAYVYGGGNDTLESFGEVDTLVLGDVSILSTVDNSGNTVLNLSNDNTITLRYYSEGKINTVSALEDTEPFNIIENSSASVTGTDAKDYIENSGINSTVLGGAGDDFIKNTSSNVSIDGGTGNDTISNSYGRDNVTITGGEGNDSISNNSFNVSIDAGAGDDYISNYGSNVSIDAGTGNDSISNGDNNVTALGGAGDDSIYNSGVNFTIYDGTGNDIFRENGVGTAYIYGGGSDTLQNFTGFDALILGDVSINSSVKNDEDNSTSLNMSSGNTIVLTNYNSDSIQTFSTLDEYERYNIIEPDYDQYNIAGTSGKDYIRSWRDNGTITAGTGNDYIDNGGNYATVDAGDGDDYIYNYGINATIDGGAGKDSIENRNNNVTAIAGAGDDSISNSGVNLTIYDDAGNDIFRENGIGTAYIYGGGSDTLQRFTGLDALILGSLSIVSSVKSDEDNAITLNISDGNSIVLTNYDSDSIQTFATVDEYERFNIFINNDEFAVVEGTDGKDYISNNDYNSTINGNGGGDYIYNSYSNVSINGGAGNDSIRSYSANTTIAGGEGNDVISVRSYNENNFVEYNAGDGNDTVRGFGENTTLIIAGSSYAQRRNGLDIVFTVGDGSIVLKDSASLSAINVSDGTQTTVIENEPFFENIIATDDTKSPITFQTDVKTADASNRKKAIQITGNEIDNTITGGAGNDTLDGAEGNDILTGGKGNDLFVFSGGNDIITDYDKKDKLSIGGGLVYEDYTRDDEDLILNFGTNNNLTITGGADKIISYLEDKKTTTTEYTADEVILGDKKKAATLTSAVESFDATSSKDYSKLVTIDGAATGAIEIIGNKKKNYIIAGATGATLNGGKGKDTLVGGAGADLFVYDNRTGKDIIEGFGEGDSISLDSDVTLKDAKTKGGDTVLKFKGGGLTVKDTTEFKLGETTYKGGVFIAGDIAKVYGSFKDKVDLSAYSVTNFDGSEGKKKLTVTGNDAANSLIGGKGKDSLSGGAGDDYLWGGKGNDTLTGGEGSDTFIYQAGGGKDVIADYTAGDLLQILSKKGDEGDFRKATFKNDTLTLGIQGGGKVLLSGVSRDTSININGNSKTVSELIK